MTLSAAESCSPCLITARDNGAGLQAIDISADSRGLISQGR